MKRWLEQRKHSGDMGQRAQSILELMFATIIILFLMYGLVKASRWGLLDMADRRIRHDAQIISTAGVGDASSQLNPSTYRVRSPDLEYRATQVPYTW